MMDYQRIKIIPHGEHVLEVTLNRPKKINAMDPRLWQEVGHFFSEAKNLRKCRCILLSGQGQHFSAGIDLKNSGLDTASTSETNDKNGDSDPATVAFGILRLGTLWQNAHSAIAECGRPVIAVIQGACIGAALEMVSASDIRLCSSNSYFAAPEVDLGIAADVGGNQRFPKLIGNDSLLRELMFTGRRMDATEAYGLGFVSHVYESHDSLRQAALDMAQLIASKSPVAVHGVKTLLNYTRFPISASVLLYVNQW